MKKHLLPAALAALVTTLPAAASTGYAVIAIGSDDHHGTGRAASYDQAVHGALDQCGDPSCRAVVWEDDGCVAVAYSFDHQWYGVGLKDGTTATEAYQPAQNDALADCQHVSGGDEHACYVVTTACTF